MYGVTDMESVDQLNPIALFYGMLEKERNTELQKYFDFRCEQKSKLCFNKTLHRYNVNIYGETEKFAGLATDKANRDVLLDILSDARTVAPVIETGRYHSKLNIQSYFYVFSHKTNSKEYQVSSKCF